MFISKNEADHFSYEDSIIKEAVITEDQVSLQVDALIVEPKNSQNTNFQRSYADTATVLFEKGKMLKGIKEGYRRYDANDKLLEEIPDRELDQEQLNGLLAGLAGQYLYDLKEVSGEGDHHRYVLGIEMATDDITGVDADSYQLLVNCSEMKVSWARYLNRIS
ncbi:MAG: hypothetical protein K6E84_05570 [Lachnospiraceae bacterium]|nr:hypothetical protein [Lachnospiraceae bacterium]